MATKLRWDNRITDGCCAWCGFPFDTDQSCRLVTDHDELACCYGDAEKLELAQVAAERRAYSS